MSNSLDPDQVDTVEPEPYQEMTPIEKELN